VIYKPLDFYGLSVNIVGAHAIDWLKYNRFIAAH
jgi:hypothetical protein